MYLNCPQRWKRDYIDKKRLFSDSIHTVFGTALHRTIQHYLSVMFEDSVKKADALDLSKYLRDSLVEEYQKSLLKNKGVHFSTPNELTEFWEAGVEIIKFFKRKRSGFFSTKHHELLGIEIPVKFELSPGIEMVMYIDFGVRDKRDGRVTFFDIKTSGRGWSKDQKGDLTKTAQLILYKMYGASAVNASVEDVDVMYLIGRRVINEDAEFKPKRIQTFAPASGKGNQRKVKAMLDRFVSEAFDGEGNYNTDREYPAIQNSLCRFCPYDRDGSCAMGSRTFETNGKANRN